MRPVKYCRPGDKDCLVGMFSILGHEQFTEARLPGHFSDPDILQVGNIGLSVTEQKLTPQQYDGYVTGKFSKMFGRFPISNCGIQATNSTVLQLLVASYYIKGPTNVDRKGLLTAFNYYTTVHRAAQWGVTGAWQPGATTGVYAVAR